MNTSSHVRDQRFRAVAERFDRFVAEEPGFSAQLSIRWHGEPVVDVAGGIVEPDSVTGVYSATKGIAGLVIAWLFDHGLLEPDRLVGDYWAEFATNGKDQTTVRQLLAHQAGLPILKRPMDATDFIDSRAAATVLGDQRPLWHPGSAFGYHALMIGVLMEELARRATGRTLQDIFETEIRGPLGADFFLGLPDAEDHRYVAVADMAPTDAQAEELAARPPADAIAAGVFANVAMPDDRSPDGTSTNNPVMRRAGFAGIGGTGSAAGLAHLYAACMPGGGARIAAPEVFEMMAQQQSWGVDRVLGIPNCFGMVFMLPQPRQPYASVGAFGHDGAGGALGFADPATGIAFGYIPVPMQYPGGADHRSVVLARLATSIARSLS